MKRFWLILAMMMQLSMVRAEVKITVLSDIHVMSPELVVKDGKAWQDFLAQKRVMLDLSKQLFDEEVERLLKEKPDMVLITGDLTKDGEVKSHECVVSQLDRLREAGIKVYVIPGDHDLGTEKAFIYNGDETSMAETVDANQFASLYQMYGYGSDSTRDPHSLSYACEPFKGLVLIGIETDRRAVMAESTLEWVCQQAEKARSEGKQVLAMMHPLPFPHVVNIDRLNKDYIVKDYETVRNRLADAGIRVVLTGHMHVLEIAKDYNADLSAPIYEVITAALAAYPCAYRQLTLNNDLSKLSISTDYVKSLSGYEDFQGMAKERLTKSISIVYANEFNMEAGTELVAQGFVIHAEGNENDSNDAKNFEALYELTQLILRLSGAFNDKLASHGMTWTDVNNSVRGMLTDTSSYGNTARENQTNDLQLTIEMPEVSAASTIKSARVENTEEGYYTLQGIRVKTPQKGLYIRNGKKVVR